MPLLLNRLCAMLQQHLVVLVQVFTWVLFLLLLIVALLLIMLRNISRFSNLLLLFELP